MTEEYIGTRQVTAWAEKKNERDGYAVKYPDGTIVWQPKDVFEAGYLSLGHILDKPAFLQRLIGERAQLNDRVTKLEAFLPSDTFKQIPAAEQARLTAQAGFMKQYLAVIDERIVAAT